MLHRWIKFGLFVIVVFYLVDLVFSVTLYQYEAHNYATYQQGQEKSLSFFNGPFSFYGACLMEWAGRNSGEISAAITAIATGVIAWFTIILARATGALTSLAKQQEITDRVHERAYLFGGGPLGFRKKDAPDRPPIATDYEKPWNMSIQNFGRTPGFVTAIQWGLCPKEHFGDDFKVDEVIKNPLLCLPSKVVINRPPHVDDPFAPGGKAVRSSRVEFVGERSEYVGQVFFGRIDYKDVFGCKHHSTFKLLLNKDHSDPLSGSFSDKDGKS